MRRLLIFVSLVLTVATLSGEAFGCSCIPKELTDQTPAEIKAERKNFFLKEFKGSLFIGRVAKVELVQGIGLWEGGTERKVTIRVDKYWLKAPSKMTVVRTGMGDSDCGVRFEVGKTYVFSPHYFSGALRSGLCNYLSDDDTGPNGETARELIDVLGKPKKIT